jgi:hypothetical protein
MSIMTTHALTAFTNGSKLANQIATCLRDFVCMLNPRALCMHDLDSMAVLASSIKEYPLNEQLI